MVLANGSLLFSKEIETDSLNGELLYSRATKLYRNGKYDSAIVLFKDSNLMFSKLMYWGRSASNLTEIGKCWHRRAKYDSAISYYKMSLDITLKKLPKNDFNVAN